MFNTDYDAKLVGSIDHYKVHGEMLPYIGKDYIDGKILLVSESHYVPEGYSADVTDDWYNSNEISFMEGNSMTREVIGNYLNPNKSGHRLFSNLNSALRKTNHEVDLTKVAWYNFYQKPARYKSEIQPTVYDKQIALYVFENILKIIDPNLVIFVSKNAFGSLTINDRQDLSWDSERKIHFYKNHSAPIGAVTHPNSSWWNRKHGPLKETGQNRFIRIINEQK